MPCIKKSWRDGVWLCLSAGGKHQRRRTSVVVVQRETKYSDDATEKSKSWLAASWQPLENIAQTPASRHEVLLAGRITSTPLH